MSITVTLALAAVGAYFAHRKDRRDAREQNAKNRALSHREMYQRLELAAVDLFRFEADHVPLTAPIWEGREYPMDQSAADNATRNYLCQILNLFEMTVAFRREDVLSVDVFDTWVPWMFEVTQAPGFEHYWPTLRPHYTETLRSILDQGSALRASDPPEQRQEKFSRFVRDIKFEAGSR